MERPPEVQIDPSVPDETSLRDVPARMDGGGHRPGYNPRSQLGLSQPTTSPAEFEPTQQIPGTWGKLRVLIARVANGQPLFHPDDYQEKG